MHILKKFYHYVGLASEWSGRVVMVAVAVLIVTITYDVFMRYVFNDPTRWSYTLSYMLGTAVIALGLPYVYYRNSNVRVDVVYSKLSPVGKLIVDICLTILFFFPLIFMLTKVFGQDAWQAYVTGEIATESVWYPLFWPFKTVVFLGFLLLFLQGITTFMRDVISLSKGGKEPW